jgi:hypothetical protein
MRIDWWHEIIHLPSLFTQQKQKRYVHEKQIQLLYRPTHCVGGGRERLRRKKKMFLDLGPIFQSGFATAIPRTLSNPFPGPSGPDHIAIFTLIGLASLGSIRSVWSAPRCE